MDEYQETASADQQILSNNLFWTVEFELFSYFLETLKNPFFAVWPPRKGKSTCQICLRGAHLFNLRKKKNLTRWCLLSKYLKSAIRIFRP